MRPFLGPRAILFLALLVASVARPGNAQYMYLDTNGDGIHTPEDRLPFSEGEYTNVDVWLDTASNRDGSPASCASPSLQSYEFCLRAPLGAQFGAFTNRLSSFGTQTPAGEQKSFTEYDNGFGGGYLPPGKYRLATLQVRSMGGTSLDIEPVSSALPVMVRTSFGSGCGELVLGSDWHDVDGLAFGSINHPPAFGQATDMVVPVGAIATEAVVAQDEDNQPVTINVVSVPTYATVEVIYIGSSATAVRVRLVPGPGDLGLGTVALSASDGTFTVPLSFHIDVRPPVGTAGRIDFETPALAADVESQVIDPYVDPATDVQFVALPSGSFAGVVGLVKNRATSACVEPADTNQKLGTAPIGSTAIGRAGHPIVARFRTPLQPPVFVTVEYQGGAGSGAELDLLDSSGNTVGSARELALPADGTCGFPGPSRGRVTLTAGSIQPVAAVSLPGSGTVYVIDNLTFAETPVVVNAPGAVSAEEGTMLTFTVSGVAARGGHVALSMLAGAPTGATFLDNGDNSGTFRWTPTFDQGNPPPSHSYTVVFLGTDEQALSGRAQTTISVNNVNRTPTANAGGPYSGTAGAAIAFSGTASSDPDGDALTYAWDFGDSKSASGPTPSHIYATSGTYAVNLEVTDNGTPPLSDTATTSATIESQLPANVFQLTTGVIKLNKSKPSYCFEIEPEGDSYSNTDIIPASIVMKYGTGQISAEGDRNTVHSDVNRNGIDEARACFSRVSLQSLFLDLPSGDNVVTIAIEGDLTTGGRFRGVTDVTIRGPVGGSAMTASVSPNPFNPASVLTIFMPKAGFVAAKLYDLSGRLIRVLMEDPDAAAGYHDVRLDGQAGSGERLASGIYFYRVETREDVLTGRFAIMR